MRQKPTSEIAQLRAALEAYPAIRLAIVFGSVAAGNARFESDVDLAVQADDVLSAEDRTKLIADIATRTGRAVDLVDLQTVGEPLLGQILHNGRRILGNAEDHAALVRKHVYANEDFVPYVRRMLEERRRARIG